MGDVKFPQERPMGKSSNQDGGLIAQIKAFKFRPKSSSLESILMQHAFTFWQLVLAPRVDTHKGGINCECFPKVP